MKKIIQEWLMSKAGLVIELQNADFKTKITDGHLIGQVLQAFEVISAEELSFIKPTADKSVAFDNFLNYILIWLGRLDIRLKDTEIEDILNAQGNAGMNLFYAMYLALQDKSKLHFITQRRALEKCRKEIPKYQVDRVKESILDDFQLEKNPYRHTLLDNRDIIKWHKDRLVTLKKQCDDARKEYSRYFNAKRIEKPPEQVCTCQLQCVCPKHVLKDEIDYPDQASQDFTYEELIEERERAKEIKEHEMDYEDAKRVVKQLKKKRQEFKEKELQKTKLHTELCEEFWLETLNKQERKISEMVDEKVLAESHYEKQMMNRMHQVKHQQEVIKENRQFVNDQILKQREDEVVQKILLEQRMSDECVCDFLYERERLKQLHRRVFAEKQRLKKIRVEKICRDAADDLVNLAIRVGEYKDEYEEEPSRRRYDDWVSLFLGSGSILPKRIPTEDAVKNIEDVPDEERDPLIEEIERQEILDTKDFEKYNKNEWPWDMANVDSTKLDFKHMERGMNVIGYIVHRLLLTKYPETPLMPKPDFKFEYNVCINGLTDTSVIGKLQSLLCYKEIVVFEVVDALNYCLNMCKTEQAGHEEDDNHSVEKENEDGERANRNNRTQEQKGKKGKKTSAINSKKSSVSSYTTNDSLSFVRLNENHQRAGSFPSEEFDTAHAAHLGEIAQHSLNEGEPLTEFLLAAMIIEFLHSIKDKKGWALLNYPNNFNQAITLEENLSSTPLTKDSNAIMSIMDLAELNHHSHGDEMILRKEKDKKRYSRIFPIPAKVKDDDTYNTYLTAYIKIIKTTPEETRDIEGTIPPVIRYLDDSAEHLEKFYADQGCCYFLYYEMFDYETVKFLAKLIIGDFSLPRKPSIELFGKSVLLGQEEQEESGSLKLAKVSKEITGKEKPKKKLVVQNSISEEVDSEIFKEKKRAGKSRKSRSSHFAEYENKEVQVPCLEDIYEIIVEEDDPSNLPGDEKWKYVDMPMPTEIMIVLAKMCENMEKLYIEDFKQVLFMRRSITNSIQPFIAHTKKHLLQFIQRPDERQDILHDFQMTFNDISECLRSDDEVKAELYCRADELRAALIGTSETNIMESFNERDRVIEQHWLRKQLHQLVQVYVCGLQLELDRCVDTLQLLIDYYVTGITHIPWEETPLQKEILRVPDSDNMQALGVDKYWEDAFDIKYFNDQLAEKIEKAMDFVDKTKNATFKVIAATQGKFALGKLKPDKQKEKVLPGIQMSDIVRDKMDKIVEEWKVAIEGEVERVTFRLKLLKFDSETRLKEISDKVRLMMTEIYGVIRKRLNNGLSSINQLCDLIATAIENEIPIQAELLLDTDQFYVQPEVLLFPEDLPPAAEPVKEWKSESVFTIQQLRNLHRVLLDLAPKGIMPERMFTFLLQDMLVQDVEDGREPLAPDLWRQLTSLELETIINEIYAKSEYVNWKDFIIYNLMILMPTTDQLLELKRKFLKIDTLSTENVPLEEFKKTNFWFENSFCRENESDMERLRLLKELICDMYKIDRNTINYSALLVDFCKDKIGVVGFAKLLSVILGRPVCWDANIGKAYVQYQLRLRALHEENVKMRDSETNYNEHVAQEILNEVVDETVHLCESVVITDVTKSSSILRSDTSSVESSDLLETCSTACLCDDRCFCSEKTDVFSNVAIEFEANFDPSLVYFLEFGTILAVEAAVLHWSTQVQGIHGQSFRQILVEIYNDCKSPTFNDAVLAHDFLNHNRFSKLLENTTRFTDKNPSTFLQNLITFRK